MIRAIITTLGILLAWHLVILVLAPPRYIFPGPWDVMVAFVENVSLLIENLAITSVEIIVGLFIGCVMGMLSALLFAGALHVHLEELIKQT